MSKDKIKEARDYIEKYTKSAHALVLFDEAIKSANAPNIEKLINDAKLALTDLVKSELYIPSKQEQVVLYKAYTPNINLEQLQIKIDAILNELKAELVSGTEWGTYNDLVGNGLLGVAYNLMLKDMDSAYNAMQQLAGK